MDTIDLSEFDASLQPSEMPEPVKQLPAGYTIFYNYGASPIINYYDTYSELENRVVRLSNIPPNSTEEELSQVFDYIGDVESTDFSQLNLGVVTVKYYDIRDAIKLRNAKLFFYNRSFTSAYEVIQPVKNTKKPPNNGTIVLFHLAKGTSEEDLKKIFSKYGEIKEIRSTQGKDSQKFIEYYDTRAAKKAMKKMSGRTINKARIAIEFSLPGNSKNMLASMASHRLLPTIERVNRKI